jgi:hypothetical protein
LLEMHSRMAGGTLGTGGMMTGAGVDSLRTISMGEDHEASMEEMHTAMAGDSPQTKCASSTMDGGHGGAMALPRDGTGSGQTGNSQPSASSTSSTQGDAHGH